MQSDNEDSNQVRRDDNKNLQNAVWYSVKEIAREQARVLGKDLSEAFVAALAEVVFSQMQTMATDLEAFATHGKRSVISMEDVKLCARRNDTLYNMITETAKEITEENNSKRKKK